MKKIVFCLSVLTLSLYCAIDLLAQPGAVTNTRFGRGQDSIDCIRNLSLYQEDYRQNNYAAAIVNWRKVFKNCPQSSANNVPRGINMYQYFISRELDATKKQGMLDTLMMIYEYGNQVRPRDKGRNLTLMAQDLIRFANTPENQSKILKLLEESMTIEKEKTLAITYASYMKQSLEMNAAGQLTDEQLLDNYTKVSGFLTAALKVTPTEELAKARDMIDDGFAKSPAANCGNLVKIYTPKYEANKNDIDFLRKLTYLLNRNECTDTQLFEQASEQQVALDPSSAAAYNMAKLFLKKENFDKAVEYYESAIKLAADSIDKANYSNQLGNILLAKFNNYEKARRYALNAMRMRPGWGEPYILLANAYASGPKCGENAFEQSHIYWLIVDKLQKAKTVDPDCAAKVNPMIAAFSKHFPKKEDAFFYSVKEGDNISIGCWVNETTKARFIN